eukprot:CAMPEP_0170598826 /NCGR_PEP_ID=MMETSP0224-20130122/16459_1 /TAXON_ID=285029 /ORGANISM="Togula jolla, Strain CCCM 725" /LENGTH=944 /DNA_ID=CAMNT_0010923413 /DNA_START=8 /DNA_END=2842 /DNA_ORIENTATION=-
MKFLVLGQLLIFLSGAAASDATAASDAKPKLKPISRNTVSLARQGLRQAPRAQEPASASGRGGSDGSSEGAGFPMGGFGGPPRLSDLVSHRGMAVAYTSQKDSTLLLLDVTDLANKRTPLLASATWARGTFDESGQETTLHEPVDGTEDTMIKFDLSSDESALEVMRPILSLRTSDAQAREALMKGAWSGTADYVPRLPLPDADGKVIIDATSLIVNGFYTAGWSFAEMLASYRVHQVRAYERNMLFTVSCQIATPSGMVPVLISFSLFQLPDVPMAPRRSDDRLGFFTTRYMDLGSHTQLVDETPDEAVDRDISIIQRFNLKEAPDGIIRFYVDPTVPERWRPAFKAGIEGWNAAFKLIGHPNGIQGVLPGDPDWPVDYDPDDSRYNTISWSVDVMDVYALGLAKVDPRSGEILKSNIIVTSGWVRVWVGEIDDDRPTVQSGNSFRREGHRSQSSIGALLGRGGQHGDASSAKSRVQSHGSMGHYEEWDHTVELRPIVLSGAWLSEAQWTDAVAAGLRTVVMHEVGHTLGLRHNFKGSTGISEDCLRNASCTAENGHSVSIMDYLPVNVHGIRKGTNESLDAFSPVIGAYDKLAIQYGYMDSKDHINGTFYHTDDLDAILTQAESMPLCTDEDLNVGGDPYCIMHDMGANPLEYYSRKLEILAEHNVDLLNSSVLPGQPYTRYGQAVIQTLSEVVGIGMRLASFLGGVDRSHLHRGRNGDHPNRTATVPVPQAQQEKALDMILELLSPNASSLNPPVDAERFLLRREEDMGVSDISMVKEIRMVRKMILDAVISSDVIQRLDDAEDFADHLGLARFLSTVTTAVWGVGTSNPFADDVSWDLQLELLRRIKEVYNTRCSEEGSLNAHALAEVHLHLDKLGVFLRRSDPTTRQGFLSKIRDIFRGPLGPKGAFLKSLRIELSDLDKPPAGSAGTGMDVEDDWWRR